MDRIIGMLTRSAACDHISPGEKKSFFFSLVNIWAYARGRGGPGSKVGKISAKWPWYPQNGGNPYWLEQLEIIKLLKDFYDFFLL